MGSGIQEILLLILIIVIIFYLPKLRSTGAERRLKGGLPPLAGRLRLAIMSSLCWVALVAVLLEPWHGSRLRFIYFGIGPVAASWGTYWVVRGYRKGKR